MKLPFDPGAAPIVFTNTSGEDCPPHGMLACFGFEYDSGGRVLKFKCRKPTGDDVGSGDTVFAINGPTKAAAGKEGACFLARHTAVWAKVNDSYDFGEFEEEESFVLRIGPVADQWHMSRDGTGFIFIGTRDAAGQIHKHRVMVLQDLNGSGLQSYIVTTVNCALDGFQLEEGVLFDDDARAYVECKPIKDTVLGEITPGGTGDGDVDPVRLYCDRQTRGFIHFGLIVQAVRVGGKLTVRETGNYTAWGEYVSQSLGLYMINLWANESDAADCEVSVPVTEKCESTGPNTVGQLVKVQWEWKPGAGNGGEPSLVIADWCCA